jgi:predicted transcriptional regulator
MSSKSRRGKAVELKRRKIKKRKPNTVLTEEAIAVALRKCAGIQTRAARVLGVSQSAVSQRVSGSEYLQNIYSEIRESLLDVAEDELIKKLKEGHMTAIIFYLKCIGKSRGYTEKQEMEVSQKQGSGVLVVPGVSGSVEEWQDSIKDYKKNKDEEIKNANRIH